MAMEHADHFIFPHQRGLALITASIRWNRAFKPVWPELGPPPHDLDLTNAPVRLDLVFAPSATSPPCSPSPDPDAPYGEKNGLLARVFS